MPEAESYKQYIYKNGAFRAVSGGSGGAKVVIVPEGAPFPVSGEENTIYLIETTEHEGGGGSAGPAITDYVGNLPEINSDSINRLARLDLDEVYTPSVEEVILPDTFVLAASPDSRTYNTDEAQGYIDPTRQYLNITAVDSLNGISYYLPDEETGEYYRYNPFKIGVARQTGSISFNLTNTARKTYLILRSFFTYASGTYTNFNSKVTINGTTHTLTTASSAKPVETLIEITGQSSITITGIDPGEIDPETGEPYEKDNRRCFFFEGIKIIGGEAVESKWNNLARKGYVDEKTSGIIEAIENLTERQDTAEQNISTNSVAIENLNNRVLPIENKLRNIDRVGDVQIFDYQELPEPGKEYSKILARVNNRVYTCVTLSEGIKKEFSFENVVGTSEVSNSGAFDALARDTTNNFGRYFADVNPLWTVVDDTSTLNVGDVYKLIKYPAEEPFEDISLFSDTTVANLKVFDFEGCCDFDGVYTLPINNADLLHFEGSTVVTFTVDNVDDTATISPYSHESNVPAVYFKVLDTTGYNTSWSENSAATLYRLDEIDQELDIRDSLTGFFKVFRNNGTLKLGNSKSAGFFILKRCEDDWVDTANLSISAIDIKLDVETSFSDCGLRCTIYDEDFNEISSSLFHLYTDYESEEFFDTAHLTNLDISRDEAKYIKIASLDGYYGDDNYTGNRLAIKSITVSYGNPQYEWVDIGGNTTFTIPSDWVSGNTYTLSQEQLAKLSQKVTEITVYGEQLAVVGNFGYSPSKTIIAGYDCRPVFDTACLVKLEINDGQCTFTSYEA